MRNPLMVCAALLVFLVVLSGTLWYRLRADQKVIADLQTQLTDAKLAAVSPPEVPLPPPIAPVQPAPPPEVPSPPPAPAPAAQPVAAVVSSGNVLIMNPGAQLSPETRRADAMRQSDQTATARVLAWRDRLTLAGQTLTTEQLQALNAVATTELRRETEESLIIESGAQPTDIQAVLRMREENINRMNDTNQRILRAVSQQLTAEQIKALRTLFEQGHSARLAGLRSDRERIENSLP